DHVPPREAGIREPLADPEAALRGEDRVLPPLAEGLPEDLLRLAPAVAVGGVEEVDPGVERARDELVRLLLVDREVETDRGLAAPERHGAEREPRDEETGVPEPAVLHASPSARGILARVSGRSAEADHALAKGERVPVLGL